MALDREVTLILARIVEPNLGDTLSRYGLIRGLRELLPDVNLAVVTRRASSELPPGAKPLRPGSLKNLIPTSAERALLRNGNCLMLWTCGHDYTDDGSAIKALHVLLRCLVCRKYGARFFIVAQGAGPIKRGLTRASIRRLAASADYFSLRDQESLNLIKSIVRPDHQDRLHLTADSALLTTLGVDRAAAPPSDPPIIGMNLRRWFHLHHGFLPYEIRYRLGLAGKAGDLGEKMRALITNFARLADHCVETHGARILFIPMYPPGRQPWEIDDKIAEMVRGEMRNADKASIVLDDLPPATLLARFQSLSAMVGVRLHSTIVATACGVPSIHLAYSPKGWSYYKSLNEEPYVMDIQEGARPGGDAVLIERFDRLWNERDAYRQRLAVSIPQRQELALEPIRAIASRVGALESARSS